MKQTDSHILAERTVPRYTSYPTAPHFSAAVDGTVYGAWLDALSPDARLSLYLHVPFCAQMCHYCGCHTKVVKRREPIDAYVDTLLAEIDLIGARIGGRAVDHIHWGGGTPSMLGPKALMRVTARLSRLFDLTDTPEHAIELDPRQVTRDLCKALAMMGVNRVSLGVQDFSAHVQEAIGRVQPIGVVEMAVEMLRDVGIDDINIDLMYGLPKQTERDVRRTAMLADALKPVRLALFGYAHVPWFKTHQRLIAETDLPDASERLEQARIARETLAELGFEAIGLDHFAKPDDPLAVAAREGRLHRNFQGYTTDEADALIGLGVSSIGRLPQGYAQNAPDMGGYARAVAEGRLPVVRGKAFSDDDLLRARIIERLMCNFAVDLDEETDAAGAAIDFAPELSRLRALQDDGVVEVEGHHVRITEDGKPFVRLAASAFDAYLAEGKARHSTAV
jgi:oxygen-independent coproporphyrinogen-3 oxidase